MFFLVLNFLSKHVYKESEEKKEKRKWEKEWRGASLNYPKEAV